MKPTLTVLIAAVSLGSAAMAVTIEPATGTVYEKWHRTTQKGVWLNKSMTFGSFGATALGDSAIPRGGNLYAGSHTMSLWVDTSSITTATTLFSYYGLVPDGGYSGCGANALVLRADGSLLMGDGRMNTATGGFSSTRGDTTVAGLVTMGATGGLTNITLSVNGANGTQTVDVYLNGSKMDTLVYNGNMDGDTNPLHSWLNPNLTYGEIKTTNIKLAQAEIAAFAGLIPEPATASLSLLGLSLLMMRRRRI